MRGKYRRRDDICISPDLYFLHPHPCFGSLSFKFLHENVLDFSFLINGRLYVVNLKSYLTLTRKVITELFDTIRDNLYHPKRNWTTKARDHLKRSLGLEGLLREAKKTKSASFLSHPLPECSCKLFGVNISAPVNGSYVNSSLPDEEEVCPIWMTREHDPITDKAPEADSGEEEIEAEVEIESDDVNKVEEVNSFQAEEIESDD